MKKVLFAYFFTYLSFAIAHEPPQKIQQTLLPAISSDLLAVRAQLAPQTQSHRETHEEEIVRLKKQYETKEQEVTQLVKHIKSLEQTLQNKETELASTRTTHDAELEKLKESLHRVTYVSINQKNKIEEQEHLLDLATREIVALQAAQEDQQRRVAEVLSNGYKKLEQMKASQKERGLLT